eukprot:5636635-Amphidinium_carterae.1
MDRYFTSTRRLPPLPADDTAARQAARAAQAFIPRDEVEVEDADELHHRRTGHLPVDANTPRRWLHSSEKTQAKAGHPKLVCAARVAILSDMILKLKVLAVEKEPGKWWVMRLLHTMGLSYKHPGFDPLAKHSVEQQMHNVQNLKEKACWFMRTYGIQLSHVVNIDETCCMLVPLRQTGWSARGVASGASTGSEKDTTIGDKMITAVFFLRGRISE